MTEAERRLADLEKRMGLLERLLYSEIAVLRKEIDSYRSIIAAAGDVLIRLGNNGD